MAHRFTFTSFDEKMPKWDAKEMDFLIFQKEKAPKTGSLHWQGYVEMKSKSTVAGLKSVMNDFKMHIEVAKGTTGSNIKYCTKDESAADDDGWYEYGKPRPTQGSRTDLNKDKEILDKTKDISQVSFGNFCRYSKAFEKYVMLSIKKRCEQPEIIVYWSKKTGTGKSKTVFELAGIDAYWKDSTKWWDGYKGQDIVVMDEFVMTGYSETYIRNLWDRYPFRIEFKGGSCEFNSKRIYVTTNDNPNDWSDNIKRRIKIIIERVDDN